MFENKIKRYENDLLLHLSFLFHRRSRFHFDHCNKIIVNNMKYSFNLQRERERERIELYCVVVVVVVWITVYSLYILTNIYLLLNSFI